MVQGASGHDDGGAEGEPANAAGADRMTERPYKAARLAPPPASSPAARAVMRGNRGRDTRPELELRSILHRCGHRYRVSVQLRPGGLRIRPDLVFSSTRVAVFVDGCFWHSCPEHGSVPRTNAAYWGLKLRRNVQRDLAATAALEADGWRALRFWEHVPAQEMADEIARAVDTRRHLRAKRGGHIELCPSSAPTNPPRTRA